MRRKTLFSMILSGLLLFVPLFMAGFISPAASQPPSCDGMTLAECEAMFESLTNCEAQNKIFKFEYNDLGDGEYEVVFAGCVDEEGGGDEGGGDEGGGPPNCNNLTPQECSDVFEQAANCEAQELEFVFLYHDLGDGEYTVEFAGCVDEGGYQFQPVDCDGLTIDQCAEAWANFTGCIGLGLEFYFEIDVFEGGGYEFTTVMCVAPEGMEAGPLARPRPVVQPGQVTVQVGGVWAIMSSTTVSIWDDRNPNRPALDVSPEQINGVPVNPDDHTLISTSEDGYYNLYRLTTGEIQLNVGPDFEGKTQVIIFDPASMTIVRQYTIAADGTTQ